MKRAQNRKHNPGFGRNAEQPEQKMDFSITETVGGNAKSKGKGTQPQRVPRILVDKCYVGKLKAHSDIIARKDIYLGNRLFTQPVNERVLITKDCPDLQTALNSFSGQHAQAKLIELPPGVHKGCFRLDRMSSTVSIEGSTLGLRIVGDSRYIAGMTYTHGVPLSYNSLDKGAKGTSPPIGKEGATVELITEKNHLRITTGASNPDFSQLGLTNKDRIILRTEHGELTERVITAVDGNTIAFSGLEISKVTAITFCPNVVFIPDENESEPSFVVANASVTFRGIRFSVPTINGNDFKSRSNILSVIGSSTVNVLGCMFDDLSRRVKTGVSLSVGAVLFSGEIDDIGRESKSSTIYPITVLGCEKTAVKLTSGSTLAECCLTIMGCAGAGCLLKAGARFTPHKLIAIGNGVGIKCYSGSICAPIRDASFIQNGISIASEVGSVITMPASSFAPSNVKVHTVDGQLNNTFGNQLIHPANNAPVALTMNPGMCIGDIRIYAGKEYFLTGFGSEKHTFTLTEGATFIGLGSGNCCRFCGDKDGESIRFLVLDEKVVLVTACNGVEWDSGN